jgi:hypothetical protein
VRCTAVCMYVQNNHTTYAAAPHACFGVARHAGRAGPGATGIY